MPHRIELTEARRLEALRSYEILDTPEEKIFTDLARVAAAIVGTPVALVSLVDGERQWFKAKVGLNVEETPRNVAFCAHAIRSPELFVVTDATQDARFSSNPLVTSGPEIRFYAGAPLIASDGHALGTLCVIDFEPRELPPEKAEALRILSRQVMAQLHLRRELQWVAQDVARREVLLRPVREAVTAERFQVHYQPQVDALGRIIGAEALLRWLDPERGWIPPAEFVPLLEETGLIADVGEKVIRRVAQDYACWSAAGLTVPPLSVNLSAVQIQHPQFVERALAAVGDSEIHFELTEAVFLSHSHQAISVLNQLRARGHRISLDDFGTGYSSLQYLADLPIDALKIDRSFVTAMTETSAGLAMVSTIIALARGLHMDVVAEGVERADQQKLLKLLGCGGMQGWLFAKAMPAREFAACLNTGRLPGLAAD